VQILKKEKNQWVQTTGLDSYSLKEVNEFSRNDSDEFLVRDYDEGFEKGLYEFVKFIKSVKGKE
jgi:hypothetical protein